MTSTKVCILDSILCFGSGPVSAVQYIIVQPPKMSILRNLVCLSIQFSYCLTLHWVGGEFWRKVRSREYPGERLDPGSIQEKGWIQGVSRRKVGSREYPVERLDPGSIMEKGWIQGVTRRKVGFMEYPGEWLDPGSIQRKS